MNLLNLKSNNQTSLLGYDDLFLKIVKLFDNKKLPNKILLSGSKGIGKSTFAYHLANYILSKNEEFPYDLNSFNINSFNKSFNLVKNNSHPNFFLIDLAEDKKVIEISQVREMINYSNKSTFNNREKIILIDNAEFLNANSSNALLKIIEEPNDRTIFILVFDSNKKILDTIKSRCISFNLSLSFRESINITNKIINGDINDLINPELINYYNTIGDFINLINFSKNLNLDIYKSNLRDFLNNIIDNKAYKKDIYIKDNVNKFIELYLLKLFKSKKPNKKISYIYENFIKKNFHLKKFNLDEESFFIEFKAKILNG